jgi:hypothetical protein
LCASRYALQGFHLRLNGGCGSGTLGRIMVIRTSFGLQGWLLLLVVFGSAALAFVVPRPRLLWTCLLAVVSGFCAGRLAELSPALLAPVVLGAGFAWRAHGWDRLVAVLGIPFGIAVFAGTLSQCWSSGCDEPFVGAIFIYAVIGAVLAIVGAALTVALRALARRLRS